VHDLLIGGLLLGSGNCLDRGATHVHLMAALAAGDGSLHRISDKVLIYFTAYLAARHGPNYAIASNMESDTLHNFLFASGLALRGRSYWAKGAAGLPPCTTFREQSFT
jgi:hypothetical protein